MFQSLIHKLLKRRHFWRCASFSEVAELYASRTLRMLALNIMAVFTSVYMYQNSCSLVFTRGLFDAVDRSGKRIEYLFIIEMAVNFGAAIAAVALGLLILVLADQAGFGVFFVVAGLVTLLIMTPRFVLYRR